MLYNYLYIYYVLLSNMSIIYRSYFLTLTIITVTFIVSNSLFLNNNNNVLVYDMKTYNYSIVENNTKYF